MLNVVISKSNTISEKQTLAFQTELWASNAWQTTDRSNSNSLECAFHTLLNKMK